MASLDNDSQRKQSEHLYWNPGVTGQERKGHLSQFLHLIAITLLRTGSEGSCSSSASTASQAKALDEDMEAIQYQALRVYGILALAALAPPTFP
jgi:hypothetical protein